MNPNTADVVGKTYKIGFVVNITNYAHVNADIWVNVFSNAQVVLKYKKGGGAGYDGDVTLSGTNIFYVIMTPDDAKKLNLGKLYVEAKLAFTDPDYPDGRVEVIRAAIKDLTKRITNVGA